MSSNKKGQYGGMNETIPGYVMGAVITIIIIAVLFSFWSLFFNSGGIDSTTRNTFDLVVNDILDMHGSEDTFRNTNMQFKEEYSLVAFNSTEYISSGECSGFTVLRPVKSCEGACICICLNEAGENMCNTKNVLCRDFTNLDLDFKGSCNLVEGTGGPQGIKLVQEDKKFTLS